MMKCIAIDDEPLALRIIKKYCEQRGGIDLTTYTDPVTGIEAVRTSHPDLLLLDIEMSGINGVTLARTVPRDTMIVFTTAYSKYALDGFEVNAIDFLHKPFAYDRFSTAIDKVEAVRQMRRLRHEAEQRAVTITVKSEYKNVTIDTAAILYVNAMDNYVRLVMANGSKVLTQMSMKAIMELLPDDRFVRVHKSFIVGLRHVAGYTRDRIELHACDTSIPIGRAYQEETARKLSVKG